MTISLQALDDRLEKAESLDKQAAKKTSILRAGVKEMVCRDLIFSTMHCRKR